MTSSRWGRPAQCRPSAGWPICAGSCDYVAGQAFSFVQNIDAIGAWPPKRDSHVEMDGAWALYEAFVRLLLGDIDAALAMGSGRSSTADPALIYPMEMDPFYLAPLGADALSFAAMQARALLAAGKVTQRQMAEIAARCHPRGHPTAPQTSTGKPASPGLASRSTAPSSTCPSPGMSQCGSKRTTSPSPATAGRWSRTGQQRSGVRSR
jgi:hypothetical protein